MQLCLIPICKCKLPFVRSFAAFTTQGLPSRLFVTFTENICFFLGAFVVGHIKEKLCGESCNTMMCCGSYTSPPMQAHMSLVARARPSLPMERSTLPRYRGPNGILL